MVFVSVILISQETTQEFNFVGKDLMVCSEYNCSEKNTLNSNDFTVVSTKIPKWIYKFSDPEELNEELDKNISENFNVLEKRKVVFKSFGNEFLGYLYKVEKEGRIICIIISFGIIEDAINLVIKTNNESFQIDEFKFPNELIELINITDFN